MTLVTGLIFIGSFIPNLKKSGLKISLRVGWVTFAPPTSHQRLVIIKQLMLERIVCLVKTREAGVREVKIGGATRLA